MTLEYKQSLMELDIILSYMNIEFLKKIPKEFIKFVNDNKDINYNPNIDNNIPINEQKLNKNTKILLSLLYRNYWCDNETKNRLISEDLLAKKNYEKEMEEKYNSDNIFKSKIEINKKNVKANNSVNLVEYKEITLFKKILNNVKKFFINLFKKG